AGYLSGLTSTRDAQATVTPDLVLRDRVARAGGVRSRLGGGGPGARTLEVGQWRLRQRPLRWLGLRARFVDHVEIGVVAPCLFSGRSCGLVQLGRIEVGISGLLALGPGAGVGRAAHLLELSQNAWVLVDTGNDEVSGVGEDHGVPHCLDLGEHSYDVTDPGDAGGDRLVDPSDHMLGALAAGPSSGIVVLAHDEYVEVFGGDGPQLSKVVVAAVARAADHADPTDPGVLGRRLLLRCVVVDELADRPHAGRVVAVVDDHPDALDIEHVEAAGG